MRGRSRSLERDLPPSRSLIEPAQAREPLREPWNQSKGLLLEYTHLLTSGERLANILRDQVADRARDMEREAELAVLRVTAAAGSAGATVEVGRLPDVLNYTEESISRALRRLFDEHLIREAGPGRIGAETASSIQRFLRWLGHTVSVRRSISPTQVTGRRPMRSVSTTDVR